jgi:hypothetical protein
MEEQLVQRINELGKIVNDLKYVERWWLPRQRIYYVSDDHDDESSHLVFNWRGLPRCRDVPKHTYTERRRAKKELRAIRAELKNSGQYANSKATLNWALGDSRFYRERREKYAFRLTFAGCMLAAVVFTQIKGCQERRSRMKEINNSPSTESPIN